jgi:hypothetical protein
MSTETPQTPYHKTPERIAYMQSYWKRNKERILAKQKAKREADPEGYKAYSKAQYEKNREKILAKKREQRTAKSAE